MFNQRKQAFYRAATTSGATQIGLLLVVYDAIAQDLQQAGEAAAHGRVEQRCATSNHALTLIGHLESWLAALEDAPLREALHSWYGYLRERILALQGRGTAEDFFTLATLVLEVRASWSAKEQALTTMVAGDGSSLPTNSGTNRSGWSA